MGLTGQVQTFLFVLYVVDFWNFPQAQVHKLETHMGEFFCYIEQKCPSSKLSCDKKQPCNVHQESLILVLTQLYGLHQLLTHVRRRARKVSQLPTGEQPQSHRLEKRVQPLQQYEQWFYRPKVLDLSVSANLSQNFELCGVGFLAVFCQRPQLVHSLGDSKQRTNIV